MRRAPDISTGAATLVRHNDGGWAVPGGTQVYTFDEAHRLASAMSVLMAGSMANGGRQLSSVTKPAVITVRAACPVDGQRWRTSA